MERFEKKQNELIEKGHIVMNPAALNSLMPEDTTHEEYMKMSFCMLSMCEAIYMMKGWEASKGANQEYGYAVAKDMLIIKEEQL